MYGNILDHTNNLIVEFKEHDENKITLIFESNEVIVTQFSMILKVSFESVGSTLKVKCSEHKDIHVLKTEEGYLFTDEKNMHFMIPYL